MGDGWETRRRRQPGDDWAILRTGRSGFVKRLEIETRFFKGNSPAECAVHVCYEPKREIDVLSVSEVKWTEILPRTPLRPDSKHVFEQQLRDAGRINYVRLRIYPDGGISRFRVWGQLEEG